MALTIRDTKTSPLKPDRWSYPDVNGNDIVSNSHMNLKREVIMHYTANGKEPPSDQELTDYLCKEIAIPCNDGNEIFRNRYTDRPSRLSRGMKSPNWPFILEPLKLMAKEGDKGLGDIVERVVGPFGGDLFKKWHLRVFGKPCSCGDRQNTLNEEFPL